MKQLSEYIWDEFSNGLKWHVSRTPVPPTSNKDPI